MPLYSLNTITPTYWVESAGIKGGRDPMGIQNSSVVIYTNLLPGITNVTERVRYYGFHCWVLWQYHLLPKTKENNTSEYQVNFIRRSELLISFLMQSYEEHYGNIPGADFAGSFIDRLKEEGYLQFSEGSDSGKAMIDAEGNKRSYWAFSSGAYGQYYFGVLSHFNLVDFDKEKKFHLLENRGRIIAEAFDKSISKQNKEKFLSIVLSGKLNYDDLKQIHDFNIQNIPMDSVERKSYIDLFTSQDSDNKESFQRRETLLSYIKYGSNNDIKNDQWLGEFYFTNTDKIDFNNSSASLGWFIYYAQELIHFGEETILYALINVMNQDIYHVNDFLEYINDELLAIDNNYNKSLKSFLGDTTDSPLLVLSELKKLIKNKDNKSIIYNGFRLKYLTYKIMIEFLNPITSYINHNNLGTPLRSNPSAKIGIRRGSILEFHNEFLRDSGKLIIDKLMENIKSVLNDHQMIAFKKMGNADGQVHKFIVEHNHLYPTGQIVPGFTSPRLNSVKAFLKDLNLIDRTNQSITEQGHQLLNKYNG
jgi:hypothetical protein